MTNKICRFKECGSYGNINAISVKVLVGNYELVWCSKCGRIQNNFR